GDDDVMVGAADPFQLFRIMHEIVEADALRPEAGVHFMLDQCHNIEDNITAQIRSVMNVQEATAKALLVDHDALREAQLGGDVLGANEIFMDAYNTDVRPLLAEVREEKGLATEPVRSGEHTSELQSRFDLVCRLLLEKKNTTQSSRQ